MFRMRKPKETINVGHVKYLYKHFLTSGFTLNTNAHKSVSMTEVVSIKEAQIDGFNEFNDNKILKSEKNTENGCTIPLCGYSVLQIYKTFRWINRYTILYKYVSTITLI